MDESDGGCDERDLWSSPLPERGEVFLDARGQSRSLRLSWHDEKELVVLSIWREDRCAASFRLPVHAVPELVSALVTGLAAAPAAPVTLQLPPARLGALR